MTATRREAARPAWEYTDYDVPISVTTPIHRGLAMRLSDEDAEYIHDPDRNPGQRAKRVLDLAASQGYLGRHWTADQQVAAHVGQVSAHHLCGEPGHVLRAVLHAAPPKDEHIERDPRNLHEMDVVGQTTEREVPLKSGAPVRVTGVSWQDARSSISRHGEFHAGSGGGIDHVAAHRFASCGYLRGVDDDDDEMSHEGGKRTARFTPDKRVFTHTDGLDHRLFDGEHLRPAVRSYILGTITAWWAGEYRDWSKWARVFFAGSEASEWTSPTLEGNNDLDILVGVDYDGCRAANPQLAGLTDQQITDRMNAGFRVHNGPVTLTVDGIQYGPFDRTSFVNPASHDIRRIKPYAAYDVGADEWVVKPPHLPHWSLSELPKPVQQVLRAADSYARHVLKLPEPERTQQGAALFEAWHTDRSRAFSERGEGWWDIANLREKFGDQAGWWAQLVDCAHRAKQGLDAAPADWSNIPTGYVVTAKLPKTQKCDYCKQQATKRVIWAEGMGYIPVCDEHEQRAKDHVGDDYCNTRLIPKAGTRIRVAAEQVHRLPVKEFQERYGPAEYDSHGTGWDAVDEHPNFHKKNPFNPQRIHAGTWDAFVEHVRQHGIQEPVEVEHWGGEEGEYDGEVISGHHRVKAAEITGQDVPFVMVNHRSAALTQEYTAAASMMYHWAPKDARDDIAQHGLDHTRAPSFDPSSPAPHGVFLHHSEETARDWVPDIERTHDLYAVDTRGLDLRPDPYDTGDASYTEHPVPPDRLRRVTAVAQIWITPQLVMGSAAGLNHARQVNSASEAVAAIQQGLTAVLPRDAWFPVRQVLLGLGMSLLDVTQRLRQLGAPTSVTG